nr:hypothetical protein [uncultured Shinella sp.]
MTNPPSPSTLHCPECKNAINEGAKRCGSCGTELNKTARYLLRISQLVAAALVIVPLWEIAVSTTDLLKTTSSFKIVTTCWQDGVIVSFTNAEKDRVLEWSDVRLVSINEIKVDEPMTFQAGETFHIPPLSTAKLTFYRQEDGARTASRSCVGGCAMKVSLTARELDGSRPTTAFATCPWTPTKQPLG